MTDTIFEPTIITTPHSPTAEEAVIGCVLIDPELLGKLDLQPEDFYIVRNRWVYQAMTYLRKNGKEVNYITVCALLDERKQLQEIGGPQRITGYLTGEIHTYHARATP